MRADRLLTAPLRSRIPGSLAPPNNSRIANETPRGSEIPRGARSTVPPARLNRLNLITVHRSEAIRVFPPPINSARSRRGVLRCHTCKSGYRNVYEKGQDLAGNVRYVARVKVNRRLLVLPGGQSTMAHVAAAAVVKWYRERFGERWALALRARKHSPRRVWRSESRGGYIAAVWLFGQRTEVRPVTKSGVIPTDAEPLVFSTKAEALAGCLDFSQRVCGENFRSALWRA